jgi:hypothetical protein
MSSMDHGGGKRRGRHRFGSLFVRRLGLSFGSSDLGQHSLPSNPGSTQGKAAGTQTPLAAFLSVIDGD